MLVKLKLYLRHIEKRKTTVLNFKLYIHIKNPLCYDTRQKLNMAVVTGFRPRRTVTVGKSSGVRMPKYSF